MVHTMHTTDPPKRKNVHPAKIMSALQHPKTIGYPNILHKIFSLSTSRKVKGRPGRPLAQAEVTSMQRPLSRFKPVLFMYFCGPLGYTYATELLPGDSTLFDLYKTAKHYNIAPSSRIYASKHYSRKVHAIEVHHTKPANIQCKSKHFMM